MKVQLEKSFALGGPAAAAWALLQDLEAVASCMPGARITEKLDDRHVKGTVMVKLGPASLVFRGEVQVKDVDTAGRSLFLVGRGTDATGTSGAAMDLRAHVEEAGTTACRLVGAAEVSVSGKAATFGGRMMSAVADQVLQQFASNFAEKLHGMPPPEEPPVARTGEPAPAAAAGSAGAAASAAAANATAAATAPRELNGLALLWGVLRDWVHHLFPARRA
jgi:carbon monoxide dehydrogenase subunit G